MNSPSCSAAASAPRAIVEAQVALSFVNRIYNVRTSIQVSEISYSLSGSGISYSAIKFLDRTVQSQIYRSGSIS